MSGLILTIGILFFLYGIGARFQRREERTSELAGLDEQIRVADFWGHDANDERKARAEKVAEYKNWRNNIKFELFNWVTFLIGAALCLFAVLDESRASLDRLWESIKDRAIYVFIGGIAIYYAYQLLKRLEKAESEIRWLNYMLKGVKDHAEDMRKGSINNILQLAERVKRLEG